MKILLLQHTYILESYNVRTQQLLEGLSLYSCYKTISVSTLRTVYNNSFDNFMKKKPWRFLLITEFFYLLNYPGIHVRATKSGFIFLPITFLIGNDSVALSQFV